MTEDMEHMFQPFHSLPSFGPLYPPSFPPRSSLLDSSQYGIGSIDSGISSPIVPAISAVPISPTGCAPDQLNGGIDDAEEEDTLSVSIDVDAQRVKRGNFPIPFTDWTTGSAFPVPSCSCPPHDSCSIRNVNTTNDNAPVHTEFIGLFYVNE
ncbi:hypothetical protein ADUPG1_006084 [Aduncisulcus paluster]|uniref:Uncharacterized protein n=1 Tax=Aduncisulcus paluster TaxID=2918883 RepID=A0ABQ5KGS8_9EUKA|nr:hypothetical protein ADUPG1_006084 [Aduncisulcus paluster]